MSKWAWTILPPLLPAIVIAVTLELLVRKGVVLSFLVPAPSEVWHALLHEEDLWVSIYWTSVATLAGFGISALAGIVLAVGMSSTRWIERMLYPYAIFFQTVPVVAIAPLLVIWIGYNMGTPIASALLASIFPVIASTFMGLRSTDPALVDLFRLYGASRMATLIKLRLPSALPAILTGLKIAGGLAVVGAVVGEFIAGTGIGDVIMVSRQQNEVEKVFAGLLLAAGLGVALFGVINLATNVLLRNWHSSERSN
jgi:NitT/TauT family transport system permease protein